MPKILWGLCISMILFSGAVWAQSVSGSAQGGEQQVSMPSQLVVYYFHGNARCSSCYKLEQYAKEAVEQNFAEEMKTGKIVFKKINVDQRENRHFINDYQLYTKAVVISLVKDGREVSYKNLDKIWNLLRDQNKYHDYIRDEIRPFMGALS